MPAVTITELNAPAFLIAAPQLRDPNFHRAVVLLVAHGEDGSLGYVVNRPTPLSLHDLLEGAELSPSEDLRESLVGRGGPVAPGSGWLIYRRDARTRHLHDADDQTIRVNDEIAVSSSRLLLEAIARGDGPRTYLLLMGYAGWGSGQLEAEINTGSWLMIDVDAELLFDTPAELRWERALEAFGGEAVFVVGDDEVATA